MAVKRGDIIEYHCTFSTAIRAAIACKVIDPDHLDICVFGNAPYAGVRLAAHYLENVVQGVGPGQWEEKI